MSQMAVRPLAHRLERFAETRAIAALVDFHYVKDLKHAVPLVQVQLQAAHAPVKLHVEGRMAVVKRLEVAMRPGTRVIAVVRADELQLIDPQFFQAGRLDSCLVWRRGRGKGTGRGRQTSKRQDDPARAGAPV